MAEQRRIGYRWNLRQLMAQRNLWKTTELLPLLKARGINLSSAQVHRLVTGTPERIPAHTFSQLAGTMPALRRTPPNRRPLARRRNLRLLLPASQKNPRHLRLRPRRGAAWPNRRPANLQEMLRHQTQR